MTTTLPTRQQIDNAGELSFERKPARQDLTITVRCTIDSFPTEVCFTGSIDQLLSITKRLREMGAAPTIATPAAQPKPKSERVSPAYSDDGSALCPVHRRELKQGQWGMYCSAKDKTTGEYCKLKFSE